MGAPRRCGAFGRGCGGAAPAPQSEARSGPGPAGFVLTSELGWGLGRRVYCGGGETPFHNLNGGSRTPSPTQLRAPGDRRPCPTAAAGQGSAGPRHNAPELRGGDAEGGRSADTRVTAESSPFSKGA